MLSGLRGEDSIAELCRREGIVQNLYYRWSKEFLEAGKKRLAGDTARAATSDEVKDLRRERRRYRVDASQSAQVNLDSFRFSIGPIANRGHTDPEFLLRCTSDIE